MQNWITGCQFKPNQFKFKPKPKKKVAKYKCENCGNEKDLKKQTIIFVNGKTETKEAKCRCGNYMKDKTKYKGFGTSFQAPNDKYK
jgi:hypothetical protein